MIQVFAGKGDQHFAVDENEARSFIDRAEAEACAADYNQRHKKNRWSVTPRSCDRCCIEEWSDGSAVSRCALPRGHDPGLRHETTYGFRFSLPDSTEEDSW